MVCKSMRLLLTGEQEVELVALTSQKAVYTHATEGRDSNFDLRLDPDCRVFGYLAILMAAATVLASLMPIRAAWKLDLLTALEGRDGAATVRSRTTSGLIITQIALGFVLVCAAVIFDRMPGLIRGINPGFEIHQTLTVPPRVNTSGNNRARAQELYRALKTRILAIPGVQSLAYASLQPFIPSPPEEICLLRQTKPGTRPEFIRACFRPASECIRVLFFSRACAVQETNGGLRRRG